MSPAFGIALSAIRALFTKLDATANNIANTNTDGFKKSRVDIQESAPGGVKVSISTIDTPGEPVPPTDGETAYRETSNVSLEEEMVNLIITRYTLSANLKTLKTGEEMQKSLIDIKV
ncbi:MAG TPA: flagellar basal body rod C-terminal domain-containing protein [Syntrophales bacterium]|nr:flagellar basal body rod C-terminal domain-containing protein [Syntrophales bacterium]HOX95351.1 flagellar basal body rod C-terminal domain-containing protein [Syntrophales bacterium]HPI56598.1 flagellar basal body rod C-terminal domain-containing protein [Syntrophales bacterium]HPN24981.1 flagellar basal body rod C-terminal domain-containing protein [Syntrophales bacterium]HQM29277.1 flagellar basal body rod C-terminal domain-containing protein [Syntrophales bacterium]